MSKIIILVTVILCALGTVSAQTEGDVKGYFEGRHVTLKIDMPATKDGVSIYPERTQPLNYSEYAVRLKQHGTSVHRGEAIMITKVKLKDKHLEVQLGGGGYGTFGDDTDTSVSVPSASKSRREKNLEADLKRETDAGRRRRLKAELDDLRRDREREDRLNRALAADAAEARRARIEQKALQGGSRFNVHFSLVDASVLTPRALIEALSKYVDFSDVEEATADNSIFRQVSYAPKAARVVPPGVVRLSPPTTFLNEGLSVKEVMRLLGQPAATSERAERGVVVTTYEFARGAGRTLIAEFVSGALVRSRTETRGR